MKGSIYFKNYDIIIENYEKGTKAIYDFITTNDIKTLVGGGDSASSVNKLSNKYFKR